MKRAALTLFLVAAIPSSAMAQDGVAGSARGHFLASPDEEFGAGVSADLWFPVDMFRFGGFLGVAALPSEVDARNRIFMPLGASVAFELLGDTVGVSVRARGGIWGGATQEAKLTVGGFIAGGAYLLIALGEGVALDVGFDVWGIFGEADTAIFAPSLGLSWAPEES